MPGHALAWWSIKPIYAESGGQIGDTGTVAWDGGQAKVLDTVKTPSGLFVHHLEVVDGVLTMDLAVRLEVLSRAGASASKSFGYTFVA